MLLLRRSYFRCQVSRITTPLLPAKIRWSRQSFRLHVRYFQKVRQISICFLPDLDSITMLLGYRRAMDMLICNISALRYHRIPSICREDFLARLDRTSRINASALLNDEAISGYLGCQLHVLVFDQSHRGRFRYQCNHLWTGDLPSGSFTRIGSYFEVASPAFTLLGLASFLSDVQLGMLVHEMLGGFAVVKLPSEHRNQVKALIDSGWHGSDGWSPVLNARHELTDLWQRPPLLGVDELIAFAERSKGRRGSARLLKAAEGFLGEARSPFEVCAGLQYGLSRPRGGEGFNVLLNEKIPLSRQARALCDQGVCYADLLLTSKDGLKQLVVECQSRLIHGNADQQMMDFNRQTALASMGYEYIPLTYAQLVQPQRHRAMVRLIAEKLGEKYCEKKELLLEREEKLRRELYSDWGSIGNWNSSHKSHRR